MIGPMGIWRFVIEHFRELRDLIASGRPMTKELSLEVMARYATYPAGQLAAQATA